MDHRDQNLITAYPDGELQTYSQPIPNAPAADPYAAEPARSGSAFSLPARVLMWIVGVIAGTTILFGCGIFWIWGLDYLGVIDWKPAVSDGRNEFNSSDDDQYNEFEDFYDYFDDYFGNGGGGFINPDEIPGGSAPQGSTPGIGVTVQQLPSLDFAIDDTYTGGLVVSEINPKGALVGTDVQVGDLIVAANGQPCPTIDELDVQLKATGVGGEMTLTVARFVNGVASTFEVSITLVDISVLD